MRRNHLELPSEHVGMLLRFLREDRQMSRLALLEAMDVHGYRMEPASYANMEAGEFLMDDCEAFLDAYTAAMRLSREELAQVVRQLAFDLLRGELGAAAVRQILG